MFRVALDGNDIDCLGLMGMDVDRKPEIGGQITAHLVPRLAGIVATQHIPVLLHEQHIRPRRVHRNAVYTVADIGILVGQFILRFQARG